MFFRAFFCLLNLFLFKQARLQRGNVLLKQGRLDEAHVDYEAVVRLGFAVHKIN